MTGKSTLCQCAVSVNVRAVAETGRCVVTCGAEIDRDWVICRPCAKGNHTGLSCASYVRESIFHLVKTCASCGFPSSSHPEPVGAWA